MTPHMLTRSLDRGATIFLLVVAALGVLIPLSNLLLPAGSFLQVPTYLVALWGKYVCYAILALAIDLIWGYCGILSLGHGAFFALGGYAMGMRLDIAAGTAVRFEPGQTRDVQLVALAGKKTIYGFRGDVMGKL